MDTRAKKISVLGTEYTVCFVEAGQDEYMDKMHYGGYCSADSHEMDAYVINKVFISIHAPRVGSDD